MSMESGKFSILLALPLLLCHHSNVNDFKRLRKEVSELRNNLIALARRLRQSDRGVRENWTELMALGAIQRAEGQSTPTQIALELELRSSNLAQILGELDGRGLIQRTPDPADKRKVRLSLTEAGFALVQETRAMRDSWLENAMETSLSLEEQAQLIAAGDLMRRLALSSQSSPEKQ
jgi:DNA-binding MarR family transcriptional regulator